MTGPFDYHVFQHDGRHYRTTEQSPGIPRPEQAQLEQFVFGQTNDPAYLNSLTQVPGVMWRTVGERIALTRVLPGRKDDHGRTTLRFESLLLLPQQARVLAADVARIVRAKWIRTGEQASVADDTATPETDLHPDVVSEVLLALSEGRRVLRGSADVSLADVQAIVAKSAAQPDFSLVFKGLSDSTPFLVNLIHGRSHAATARARSQETQAMSPKQTLPPTPTHHSRRSPFEGVMGLFIIVLLLVNLAASIISRMGAGNRVSNDQIMQDTILGQIDAKSKTLQGEHAEFVSSLAKHEKLLSDIQGTLAQIADHSDAIRKALEESKTKIESISSFLGENLKPVGEVDAALQGVERAVQALQKDVTTRLGSLERHIAKQPVPTAPEKASSDERFANALRDAQKLAADIEQKLKEAKEDPSKWRKRLDEAEKAVIELIGQLKGALGDDAGIEPHGAGDAP